MKLKKIASLALAGVMAVSMLAGCATKGTETDDNQGTQVEPTTSVVADALNAAGTKVTFTEDAALTSALKAAVEKIGYTAAVDSSNSYKKLTQEIIRQAGIGGELSDLGDGLTYDATTSFENPSTGKTETILSVDAIEAKNVSNSQLLALAQVAAGVKATWTDVKLPADNAEGKAPEATYYKFGYTGKAAMVTVTDPDTGAVSYIVLTAVTRTATEATLPNG